MTDDEAINRIMRAFETCPANSDDERDAMRAVLAVVREHDAATVAALREDVARLTSAIRWALGEEGEFGEEPLPLAGKYRQRYWWRKELRARAALEGEGWAYFEATNR